MKPFIKYPKISQFGRFIKSISDVTRFVGVDEEDSPIFDESIPLPSVEVEITEKIHGTNASVCHNKDLGFWVQGRNRILTIEEDNAGCAFHATAIKDEWMKVIDWLAHLHQIDLKENVITVYYEWCGQGIQKKSAMSGVPKSAMVFSYFKVSNTLGRFIANILKNTPTSNAKH